MELVSMTTIEDAVRVAGLDEDIRVRDSYQGRGMYGKPGCVGIVHSGTQQLLEFFVALAGEDHDTAVTLAGRAVQDNMGHDTITYFPGVQSSGHDR